MNGVGFEILARTPVPKLSPLPSEHIIFCRHERLHFEFMVRLESVSILSLWFG